MNKVNENPGEPNVGSQVKHKQSFENKKVRDLSDYKVNKKIWVSYFCQNTFEIGLLEEDACIETIELLEKGKLSISSVLIGIRGASLAFQCFKPESSQFLIKYCIKPEDIYLDIKLIDAEKLDIIIWTADNILESFKIDARI